VNAGLEIEKIQPLKRKVIHNMKKIFLSAFIFVLSLGLLAQNSNKKISMFRGNAQLTGVYDTKAAHRLKGVKFTFKTDGPIRSAPAIWNNTLLFGSGDGNFYAIDSQSGKEKWRFKSGGAIHSSPAVTDGIVYFSSRDGNVYALNVESGKELWKFRMGADLPHRNGWDFFLSSPTLEGLNLYIGGGDGNVYSLNAKSGKEQWRFNTGARVRTAPAISGELVLIGAMNGYFFALDKKDGKQKWKFATDGVKSNFDDFGYDPTSILCSASVTEQTAVVGARDGFLYAIDLATGKEKWRANFDGSWVLTTAIQGNTVFTASGIPAFVKAFDINTGAEKWQFKAKGIVYSSLMISESMMYFNDYSGDLYALDCTTGVEKWHFPMGKRAMSSPLVSNGMVYTSSDEGIMFALEGSTSPDPTHAVKSKKVVYWEENKSDKAFNWFQYGNDVFIRDYFKSVGYKQMNAIQLQQFMKSQLQTDTPSVVVFAKNMIPEIVVEENSERALIRKYLDAGGKVVFLGPDPLAYYHNPETGSLDSINFLNRPKKVFGITYDAPGIINHNVVLGAAPTQAGKKYGMRDWWVGYSSVDSKQVTTVLSIDEYGKASCWIKNFGGKEGTGLLQLMIPKEVVGTDIFPLRAVIEYGIDW
jgi:outer membrane protein assembly factor BamB